jgi:hypothetical protein
VLVENTTPGRYYGFEKAINIARLGAEVQMKEGYEIGRAISEEDALRLGLRGQDLYTPLKSDAYRLALRITPKNLRVLEHPAHQAPYFPHWKAFLQGGTALHIFYWRLGQGFLGNP